MPYKIQLMSHVRVISDLLPGYEGDCAMNLRNHALFVAARNRHFVLQPQFIIQSERGWAYSPQMTPQTRGFIGWLPYFNKQWPTGTGKAAFKQYCAEHDIPTPRSWRTPQEAQADFIVKSERESFGRGILGPFRHQPAVVAGIPEGSYCEEFVAGKIAKIWYWEGTPAALELIEMPRIAGNGGESIAEIYQRVRRATRTPISISDESMRHIAAYQGLTPETVLRQGQEMMADFRYGSVFLPPSLQNANVLAEYAGGPVMDQLRRYGELFWNSIPQDIRRHTAYSVDAILDANGKLWFLELNCNPSLHPDIYRPMFDGLFGAAHEMQAAGANAPGPVLGQLPLPPSFTGGSGMRMPAAAPRPDPATGLIYVEAPAAPKPA